MTGSWKNVTAGLGPHGRGRSAQRAGCLSSSFARLQSGDVCILFAENCFQMTWNEEQLVDQERGGGLKK